MTWQSTATDLSARAMNRIHRFMLAVSGGRILRTAFGMPVLELHTVGRRTGQRRSVMLTTPISGPDRIVLVASKGGDDRNPEWYQNLVANPDVEITRDGHTQTMRARTATAEEKEELWPDVIAAYQGYGAYQRRTEREIPLVICEPRPA